MSRLVDGKWESLPECPIAVSNVSATRLGDEIIVTGESYPGGVSVQCYNMVTRVWRMLSPLLTPRCEHGTVCEWISVCGGWLPWLRVGVIDGGV